MEALLFDGIAQGSGDLLELYSLESRPLARAPPFSLSRRQADAARRPLAAVRAIASSTSPCLPPPPAVIPSVARDGAHNTMLASGVEGMGAGWR